MTAKFAWHVHHDVLMEPLTELISVRRAFIKAHKRFERMVCNSEEQELRLRLLKPVRGKLPVAIIKTGTAFVKAWHAYNKVKAVGRTYVIQPASYGKIGAAYTKVRDAYNKAVLAHYTEIETLHAEECPDCPWDGRTIFPTNYMRLAW